jgi:hypothetical protein
MRVLLYLERPHLIVPRKTKPHPEMGVTRVVRVALMLSVQIQKSCYRLRDCRRSPSWRPLVWCGTGWNLFLPLTSRTSLREPVF